MEEKKVPNLPNPLTKNQVDAVRFQVTKPGYSFEQVEAFIEKTKATLEFLEYEMKKDKLALAEAEDEIELLTERAQTLGATLEIFKVKGDAVVSESGEFVTESNITQGQKLAQENEYLKKQLLAAQEDANAGWTAEAELRKYIEEQLLPWLNENKDVIVQNTVNKSEPQTMVEDSTEEPVSLLDDEDLDASSEVLLSDEELTDSARPDENVGLSEDSEDGNSTDDSELWSDVSEDGSEVNKADFNLSPEDILYDEDLSHEEHVPLEAGESKPLLSSDDENDWFK